MFLSSPLHYRRIFISIFAIRRWRLNGIPQGVVRNQLENNKLEIAIQSHVMLIAYLYEKGAALLTLCPSVILNFPHLF
jgi:hypothetical protein